MIHRFGPAVALWVALLGVAASAADYERCTKPVQACLDAMVAQLSDRGWVGIEYDPSESGEILIKRVVPGSPAERTGLTVGDNLVGVNGVRFAGAPRERLMQAHARWAPGDPVTYTVLRNGAETETELELILAPLPSDVLALWIGGHMLEDHVTLASK